MTSTTETPRYTAVAIILHWLMAALIIGMIFLGWAMEGMREQALAGQMSFAEVQAFYNWHKTIGIGLLILALARLGWRLTHPVPPLPAGMKSWERVAARLSHTGFYVIMIAMPVGGWLTASATNFPSYIANNPALELPHLPVPNALYETLGAMHGAGAWVIFAFLALHIGAALKHHFGDRDDVLTRMIPFLKSRV
ncbi:MAG: cytochrome b [Oceanicaulis sp.]|uniref:cytochrome b n=1 Tax=Glycocaulis sp. TaxID=1969725 RepID=UPI0025C0AA37|nr:cytochrome b [Glycocaulis sp.]MCC5981911.1 cytochrome b [Oceanicaulis sp.]MCH8521707.1 cytochrome b [Glycocaulis sp.]